ncbi:excalibur calcium-binding domain-containing protein [Parerythrobacter aurantius]|uniref:excalibur calcium-binding domain-containing protein n=1 Tax=Parerythrobacter aurantius TaxID=3127706 RepID=UPI00324F7FA1
MRPVISFALGGWLLSGIAVPAGAHPGELDKQGCHTDRSTREYHCHENRRGLPPPDPEPKEAFAAEVRRDLFFARCADARAAGYQNIRRGQPGYRPELDRDNDGIACEPYNSR